MAAGLRCLNKQVYNEAGVNKIVNVFREGGLIQLLLLFSFRSLKLNNLRTCPMLSSKSLNEL